MIFSETLTLEELRNALTNIEKNIHRAMECLHIPEKKEEFSRLQEEIQNQIYGKIQKNT